MTDRRTSRRSWRALLLVVAASIAGALAWLVRGRRQSRQIGDQAWRSTEPGPSSAPVPAARLSATPPDAGAAPPPARPVAPPSGPPDGTSSPDTAPPPGGARDARQTPGGPRGETTGSAGEQRGPAGVAADLTVVDGIGPKISAALVGGGVGTLADLAETDPARLREILAEQGLRLAPSLDSWPAQARELLSRAE